VGATWGQAQILGAMAPMPAVETALLLLQHQRHYDNARYIERILYLRHSRLKSAEYR